MGYTDDDDVSSDFMSDKRTSVFDAKAGIEINSTFFKIISCHDNEWGYSNKILDLAEYMEGVEKKDSSSL